MAWKPFLIFFLGVATLRAEYHATYTEALKAHQKTQKPLIVLVSAKNCAPCNRMKSEIPKNIRLGLYQGVEYCVILYDNQTAVSKALLGGRKICPTTVIFRLKGGRYAITRATGYKNYRELFRLFFPR